MLDKFGIEPLGFAAALAPVEDELGYCLLDEAGVDAVANHDFHGIVIRAPVVIQCLRRLLTETFGLVLLLSPPATGDQLPEFVLPGMTGIATFTPVEDEIFQLVEGELARYVVVERQQLQQVFAGRPVAG